ncbi:hypothetical protein E1182_02115 [Micromonospora sp. KC721]|nr:hypothetical protein E1182_02115 [Micromonospora sp. KC721]
MMHVADGNPVTVISLIENNGVVRTTRTRNAAFASIQPEIVGVCGTDRHLFEGRLPAPAGTVIGHEIVGHVETLPPEFPLVADWDVRVGDRVVIAPGISCQRCPHCLRYGMYCQRRKLYGLGSAGHGIHGGLSDTVELLPDTRLFRVPDRLPAQRAVFIEPVACGVRAMHTASLTVGPLSGRRALIVGFGGIGLAVATVAAYAGAHVEICELDGLRQQVAERLGFPVATPSQVEPGSYDLAVECAGVPAAFAGAVRAVRPGGTVIEMGNFADAGPGEVPVAEICQRDIRVAGVSETRDADFRVAVDVVAHSPVDLAAAIGAVHRFQDLDAPEVLFTKWDVLKQVVCFD